MQLQISISAKRALPVSCSCKTYWRNTPHGCICKMISLKHNTVVKSSQIYFLADGNNQADRMALIGGMETLIWVGRHPNIVSLVGACTFEGTAKNNV